MPGLPEGIDYSPAALAAEGLALYPRIIDAPLLWRELDRMGVWRSQGLSIDRLFERIGEKKGNEQLGDVQPDLNSFLHVLVWEEEAHA